MSEALWFDPSTSAVRDENRLAVAHLAPGEPNETGFAMAAGPELVEALLAVAMTDPQDAEHPCFCGPALNLRRRGHAEYCKRARTALAKARGEDAS